MKHWKDMNEQERHRALHTPMSEPSKPPGIGMAITYAIWVGVPIICFIAFAIGALS